VSFRVACENCTYELESVLSLHLAASVELLAFTTARGVDPLADP
jgi:hypothetical protein